MFKRKYKHTFVDRWLEMIDLKAGYQKWKKDTCSAKRPICYKTFDISNMSESALASHMKGGKHCEQAPSVSGSQISYFSNSESRSIGSF